MDTKLKLARVDAVQVHDCVRSMTGAANYHLLRQDVLKKIEEAWPEILKNDAVTEENEIREMMVTSKEQRSLAEGYVGLLNRKDQFGNSVITTANFSVVERACKTCKVWNWVKSQVSQEEIPDFDEPLDNEPPISDDEVVEEKTE